MRVSQSCDHDTVAVMFAGSARRMCSRLQLRLSSSAATPGNHTKEGTSIGRTFGMQSILMGKITENLFVRLLLTGNAAQKWVTTFPEPTDPQ